MPPLLIDDLICIFHAGRRVGACVISLFHAGISERPWAWWANPARASR